MCIKRLVFTHSHPCAVSANPKYLRSRFRGAELGVLLCKHTSHSHTHILNGSLVCRTTPARVVFLMPSQNLLPLLLRVVWVCVYLFRPHARTHTNITTHTCIDISYMRVWCVAVWLLNCERSLHSPYRCRSVLPKTPCLMWGRLHHVPRTHTHTHAENPTCTKKARAYVFKVKLS